MKYLVLLLLVISVCEAVLLYRILDNSVETDSIDTDFDGKNDLFFKFDNGYDTASSDRNRDGNIDELTIFDERGLPLKLLEDDDFDKVFESTSYFKNGVLERTEIDLNNNGQLDYLFVYDKGVLKEAIKYDWQVLINKGLPSVIENYVFNFGFPKLSSPDNWTVKKLENK